jgi:hypothetical protein
MSGTTREQDETMRVIRRLRSSAPTWKPRLVQALKLEVLFLVVPIAVGALLGPPGAGLAALLGALIVFASSTTNGLVATRYAAPLMMAAVVLGALTKPEWWWVPVVAAFAFASGVATLYGAGIAVAGATLWAAFAPRAREVDHLGLLVGYMVLGSLYGWLIARRMGVPVRSPAAPPTRRYALTLATSLALAVGIAAALAVATDWEQSTIILGAIVVLGIPTPGITEGLIKQRVIGTVAGCVLVVVASLITDNPAVLAAGAFVCVTLYLMSAGRPLTVQATFLTAAMMLPAAGTTSTSVLAARRLGYTAIGLAILAAVLLLLRFVSDRAMPPVRPEPGAAAT